MYVYVFVCVTESELASGGTCKHTCGICMWLGIQVSHAITHVVLECGLADIHLLTCVQSLKEMRL